MALIGFLQNQRFSIINHGEICWVICLILRHCTLWFVLQIVNQMTLDKHPDYMLFTVLFVSISDFIFALYFRYKVLDMSKGIEEMGSLNLNILICLLVSWVVLFLCLMKGIKSVGKVRILSASLTLFCF